MQERRFKLIKLFPNSPYLDEIITENAFNEFIDSESRIWYERDFKDFPEFWEEIFEEIEEQLTKNMTQEQFNELLPIRGIDHQGYQLIINRLDFGFLVEYGCKKLAIETKEKLQTLMELYLNSPKELYTLWYEETAKLREVPVDAPEQLLNVERGDYRN